LIRKGSSHDSKIEDFDKVVKILQLVPLESIRGEMESAVSIVVVWMLLVFKQVTV